MTTARQRARFSLRTLLVAFALIGVVLAAYVQLCTRPTLSVRALSDGEAKSLWVYGPSAIRDNPETDEDRRFSGRYRPRNRTAIDRAPRLIQPLLTSQDIPVATGGSCGIGCGVTEARIRASDRQPVEHLLKLAEERDLPVAGSVCITGILRDRSGKPVINVAVGVAIEQAYRGIGVRDDGTFLIFLDANSPLLVPGLKLHINSSPVEATWLQGGGTWFDGYPPTPIVAGKVYQFEITLP